MDCLGRELELRKDVQKVKVFKDQWKELMKEEGEEQGWPKDGNSQKSHKKIQGSGFKGCTIAINMGMLQFHELSTQSLMEMPKMGEG